MKKIIVLAVVTASLVISCKKDNDGVTDPVHYDNYAQLKVGNYWVYQIFDVDSLGQGPPLNEYDSCYISKDSIINGNTYYHLIGQWRGGGNVQEQWLRDSLHYLVDERGTIWFSSQDFNTVFLTSVFGNGEPITDTLWVLTQQMDNGYSNYSTPAGLYATLNFRATYEMYTGNSGRYRHQHRRFAKDIGIVAETLPFYATDIRYKEKRLIRYHLN